MLFLRAAPLKKYWWQTLIAPCSYSHNLSLRKTLSGIWRVWVGAAPSLYLPPVCLWVGVGGQKKGKKSAGAPVQGYVPRDVCRQPRRRSDSGAAEMPRTWNWTPAGKNNICTLLCESVCRAVEAAHTARSGVRVSSAQVMWTSLKKSVSKPFCSAV